MEKTLSEKAEASLAAAALTARTHSLWLLNLKVLQQAHVRLISAE